MSDLPTTVADGMAASIALLKELGWVQDQYIDFETGACCAVAAIHVATCNCPQNDELENLSLARRTCTETFASTVSHLSVTLIEHTDLADGDIVEWNDDSEMTFDAVREIFELAEKEARSWLA